MLFIKLLLIGISVCNFNTQWKTLALNGDLRIPMTSVSSSNVPLKIGDCEPPEFLYNGALEISCFRNLRNRFDNGTVIRYGCKNGFKLEPSKNEIRLCLNGSWTNNGPICSPVEITCTKPDHIPNGALISPDQGDGPFKVGSKIEYECKADFTLIGQSTRVCESNGEWMPRKTPFCTPTYKVLETEQLQACPPPPKVPNTIRKLIRGKQRANDALPGAIFEYACDSGYRDVKSPCVATILRCENGLWKGSLPDCVKVESCFPPPDISHGSIMGPTFDMNYPISCEVIYSCDNGYVIFPKNLAALTLRCEDNGCWAPNALPFCHPESSLFYGFRNGYDDYFHITTGGLLMCIFFAIFGITSIMVVVCSLSMCRQRYLYLRHRRRTARSESRPISNSVSATSSIIRPNSYGRTAFIAFADGIQVEQHHLPTYDEVLRQDRSVSGNSAPGISDCLPVPNHYDSNYGCAVENCDIPVSNNSNSSNSSCHNNSSNNNDGISNDTNCVANHRNVRFSSQPSEAIRHRSNLLQSHAFNRDIMGSTDTVAISEVSANTLDNVSSHTIGSGSQNPSCRAMCGSLASFDACSVITEGYPLLEEYETDNENQSNTVRTLANK